MKFFGGLLVTVATLPAFAADATGNWTVDGMIGNFPIQTVCSFTQKDSALTGACKVDGAEFQLTGQVNGSDMTWKYEVDYQGQHLTVTYKAKLDSASSMKGIVSVMDGSGEFTAKRQ